MREIKFRGWDKSTKKMYCINTINLDLKECWGVCKRLPNMVSDIKLHFEYCILMQYTGLKDKNGKEIYESDLLERRNGEIEEVVFDSGSFCIKHKNGSYDFIAENNHFKIVGNIYEGQAKKSIN